MSIVVTWVGFCTPDGIMEPSEPLVTFKFMMMPKNQKGDKDKEYLWEQTWRCNVSSKQAGQGCLAKSKLAFQQNTF